MVRPATLDDIPVLLALGHALHQESPRYRDCVFDEEKVCRLMRSMLESTLTTPAIGGIFVAEREGAIVGVFGGLVTEMWFSTDKIATDYTFYVAPEYRRKGRIAFELLKAFEAWAVAQGVLDIVPGTSTKIDPENTRVFYERMGYEMYGYAMIKRIG